MLVGTLPAVVDPWGWDRFGPAKFLWISILLTAVLAAAARGERLRHDRGLSLAWLALIAVTGLATLLAPDPLLSFLGEGSRQFGFVAVAVGFAAYLAASSAQVPPRLLARALVIGSLPVIAVGLLQVAGFDPFPTPAGLDLTRARSTFGNAAFLGGYLAVVLPVAAALGLDEEEPRAWRGVHALGFAGAATALAGTGTRGAWLGGAAGLGICAWLLRKRLWRPGVSLGALLAAGGVAALMVAAPVGGRLGPAATGTAAGRVDTWLLSASVVAQRPVLGWGPEGFRHGFYEVMTEEWVRSYGLERIPDRAHNLFADTAAATGIAGTLAFVALLAIAARAATGRLGPRAPPVAGLAAGCAAYVVHAQFLFDTLEGSVLLWLLVGTIVAGATAGLRPRPPLLAVGAVVLIGLVVLPAVSLTADRIVARALALPATAEVVDRVGDAARLRPRTVDHYTLVAYLATESREEAVLRSARALLGRWDDPDVLLERAQVQATLGAVTGERSELERAAGDLRRALEAQPLAGSAWLALGETQALLGARPEARASYERAAELLPRSVYPHANLALLELAEGQLGRARAHLRAAERIEPDHPALEQLRERLRPP